MIRCAAVLAPVICLAACKVLPPPPAVAFHGTTAADPKGETQVLLVVGTASQMFGGGGWGVALRAEHQETERTSVGVELTGGRGDGDGTKFALFALRGYGRGTPRSHDWVAVTYGAGATFLTTGMVTLTAHAGAAVSYPNRHFEPYLSTGLALAVPIRQGEPFGDMTGESAEPAMMFGEPMPVHVPPRGPQPVRSNLYWTLDPGFVVPVGDTDHALSLDVGIAEALVHPGGLLSLSIADRLSGR